MLPEFSGLGMQDQPQRIAMSEGIDFRSMAIVVHERVVIRHRAIVVEAQNFTAQAHGVLRNGGDPASGRHVNFAITSEDDTAIEARIPFVRLSNE